VGCTIFGENTGLPKATPSLVLAQAGYLNQFAAFLGASPATSPYPSIGEIRTAKEDDK